MPKRCNPSRTAPLISHKSSLHTTHESVSIPGKDLVIDNYDDLENADTRKFMPANASGNAIIMTRAIDTPRM